MNPQTRPIKPRQKTEAEKLESSALILKNRIWEGFHEREVEGYRIEDLTKHLVEVVEKWYRVVSKQTPQ